MDFILYCLDKPNRADTRREVRPLHLEYITQRQDTFRYGGPLLDEHGQVKGSLMIVNAPDRAALERHMRGDPYFGADLFGSVTVWASRQVIPEANPGALRAELDQAKQVAREAA